VTALWPSPGRAAPAPPAQVGHDAPSHAPPPLPELPALDALDALRAEGPAGLERLLATFDAARRRPDAPIAAWETAIDRVAGQRYASVSRLYWYTELDRAEQAARTLGRPILALRMLGDLRDDLSCANSRLFRATLYANTELAAWLRDHFVLYWSSERAVPTVTIDFGDGRKLVRTTTGNSVHYVLDDAGHVLDVLPGLYAAPVFRQELARSLALADQVRGRPDAERIRATVDYHAAAIRDAARTWQLAQRTRYLAGRALPSDPDDAGGLARAQRATVSKAAIEVPDLRRIGAIGPGDVPDDAAAWSAIGHTVWNLIDPGAPLDLGARATPPPQPVLDAASRALVARLHDAGPAAQRATPAELAAVVARLEQHILADTALDELRLRPDIRRRIVDHAETDLATLNEWIYADVFATPRSDPWLGLRARTDFTGLPGDGVVMP
jgi:hypothetical protein